MISLVDVCVFDWCGSRVGLSIIPCKPAPLPNPYMSRVSERINGVFLSGCITTRGSISILVEKQTCQSQDAASLLSFMAQRQNSKQKRQARVQQDISFSPGTQLSFQSWSTRLSWAPSNSCAETLSFPSIMRTFECLEKINQSLKLKVAGNPRCVLEL